jgi:hypothetical protein
LKAGHSLENKVVERVAWLGGWGFGMGADQHLVGDAAFAFAG